MNEQNIEQEVSSLYAKLEAQNAEDMKQMEILRKRIDKNTILLNALRGSLNAMNPSAKTGYGNQRDTILNAVDQIPKQRFTQDEVEAVLARTEPARPRDRDRIRAALWALATKGERIKVFKKGTNTQPAEFEKIEATAVVKNGEQQTLAGAHR
jgi:hypothetical protein